MLLTDSQPGIVLATLVAAILAAALAPAGLDGLRVPAWSWIAWSVIFAASLAILRAAGLPLPEAGRRVLWLMPAVGLLAVPAGLLAPGDRRGIVMAALAARALSAATAATALAKVLGPSGLVRGARALHAPDRLADLLESTLASVAVVLRQVKAMLRAREARRPGFGAWSDLAAAPADTLVGLGRLIAALLLRSLERADALEQARRARGGGA